MSTRQEAIDFVLFHLGVNDEDLIDRGPTLSYMKQMLDTTYPGWREEVGLEIEIEVMYRQHDGSME